MSRPSMIELLNVKNPDSPAKRNLEKQAKEEKRARQEEGQSERSGNRGRRGRTPSPRRGSSGVERERSPPREQPKKAVRPPRKARDFQDFAESRNNGNEIPTDRRARETSRVRNNDPRRQPESKRHTNEKPLPERPRQKHGQNPLPAEDFYSEHLNRKRAEELERDREIKDRERREREIKKEQERERMRNQERWHEQERIGREEEDRIYNQKREDSLERAWRARNQKEKERVAQEMKEEESARESKSRTATKERIYGDEGERTKQRASDNNAVREEKTRKTYIYTSQDEWERDRKPRDRSKSRDRYHTREGRAPPDPDGGVRPKSYIPYEYSPVSIHKSVPKPKVDRTGERVRRVESTVRKPKGQKEPRSRDIGGADPYERHVGSGDPLLSSHNPDLRAHRYNESGYAPPPTTSRTSRSTHGRTVDNNPGLYGTHETRYDPRQKSGYDPRHNPGTDTRYDARHIPGTDTRYDPEYDTYPY